MFTSNGSPALSRLMCSLLQIHANELTNRRDPIGNTMDWARERLFRMVKRSLSRTGFSGLSDLAPLWWSRFARISWP